MEMTQLMRNRLLAEARDCWANNYEMPWGTFPIKVGTVDENVECPPVGAVLDFRSGWSWKMICTERRVMGTITNPPPSKSPFERGPSSS